MAHNSLHTRASASNFDQDSVYSGRRRMSSFYKFFHRSASNLTQSQLSVYSDETVDKQRANTLVIFDGKSNSIHKFQPDSDEWYQIDNGFSKDMKKWGFNAIVLNEDIYVLMNNKSVYRLEYTDVNSTWVKMSDMIHNHGQHPPAAVVDGSIYVVATAGVGVSSNKAERYDVKEDKWIQVKETKEQRRNHCVVVAEDFIYCISGMNKTGISQSVERFDLISKRWTYVSSLPERRHSCAAIAHHDFVYVLGGSTNEKRMNSVFCYDTNLDIWSSVTSMNISRSSFTTCIVDGKIFAVGGDNSRSDTVEYYDCDAGRWEFLDMLCTLHINVAIGVYLNFEEDLK